LRPGAAALSPSASAVWCCVQSFCGEHSLQSSGDARARSAATTTIEPQFNNTGSVFVDAGTLRALARDLAAAPSAAVYGRTGTCLGRFGTLVSFLLDLSERYRQRGYSSIEFVLRMTREEIGSYLGLKLETVSRLFSRFQEEGLIQVQGRAVKLLDPGALKQLVGQRG